MSMASEELQLLIAGYVLGDLSPEEAAEFERLLAQNPVMAEELAQMQKALETAYTPPEVTPSAHLRSAILSNIHAVNPEIGAPVTTRTRITFPWRRVMEVAAAALIAALALNNYRLQQALQMAKTETPSYTPLIYTLDATKADSKASATVVVNPNNLEATIAVKNLPPLPPGRVYVLWTVLTQNAPFTTDEKEAILTETFQVDERGNFSQTITVPKAYRSKELVTKVAVTMEDANAPQRHAGSPIIITGL